MPWNILSQTDRLEKPEGFEAKKKSFEICNGYKSLMGLLSDLECPGQDQDLTRYK